MDSMTTRKLLTDMECGAYNSDSLGSPSAGASGQSGEEVLYFNFVLAKRVIVSDVIFINN